VRAAEDACATDSSVKCVNARNVASTFIYVYTVNNGSLAVASSPTAKLAKSMVARNCEKGFKCTLTGVFDPRAGGVVRHHADTAPQK